MSSNDVIGDLDLCECSLKFSSLKFYLCCSLKFDLPSKVSLFLADFPHTESRIESTTAPLRFSGPAHFPPADSAPCPDPGVGLVGSLSVSSIIQSGQSTQVGAVQWGSSIQAVPTVDSAGPERDLLDQVWNRAELIVIGGVAKGLIGTELRI